MVDLQHSKSRERMARSLVRLLAALLGLAASKPLLPEDLRRFAIACAPKACTTCTCDLPRLSIPASLPTSPWPPLCC